MKSDIKIFDKVLIHSGIVWNGKNFLNKDVLLTNGVIEKIEDNIDEVTDLKIDAENMIVSAGLIDFHTHIRHISPDSIGIEYNKISYPFGVTALVDTCTTQIDMDIISDPNIDVSVLPVVPIINNKADFSQVNKFVSAYKDKVIGLKVFLAKIPQIY